MPITTDLSQPFSSGISYDIDTLMMSPEYFDPNSQEGDRIRAIVKAAHESAHGNTAPTSARRPNPIVLDTSDPSMPIRRQMSGSDQ